VVDSVAEIRRLQGILSGGKSDPFAGFDVYATSCAACHKLHGKGGNIGPDLTASPRDDVGHLLQHIVDPSAEIREGYENFVVRTADGQVLNGFLAESDANRVVMRGLDGNNTVLERAKVVEMKSAGVSLMPPSLLTLLTETQVRDLFAYLRTTQPLVGK
jgi:putative heme-binding domain-containing protein